MATYRILTGLDWLNDRDDVYVSGDGYVQGPFSVRDNQLTLDIPVTQGYVGVAYRGEVRTLPRDAGLQGQRGRNVRRNLERVMVEYSGWGGDVSILDDYTYDGASQIGAQADLPSRQAADVTDQGAPARYYAYDPEIKGEWAPLAHVRVRSAIGLPMQLHNIEIAEQANG